MSEHGQQPKRGIRGFLSAQVVRERQLERIREQVAAGTLVIRQGTATERKRYGIKLNADAGDGGPCR